MLYELLTDNTTAVLIFLSVFLVLWITRRPPNIPPGPRGLPFIGNIRELSGDQLKATKRLRRKYGDVYSLYTGNTLAVFVHGFKNLKEILVNRGDLFIDRPSRFYVNVGDGTGISLSSGQVWKEQRRFALHSLRDLGFGRSSLEGKIQEEVEVLLNYIEDKDGEPFETGSLVHMCTANVICSMVFGKRFDHDNPTFQTYLKCITVFIETIITSSVVSFIPWLKYLPGDVFKYQKFSSHAEQFLNCTREQINLHKEKFDPNHVNDLIDAYILKIAECRSREENSSFHEDELAKIIRDLVADGAETTATTIKWALLYMVTYPEIQQKIREELQSVIGKDRLPSVTDRPNLPYTEATLMEVQRHADIRPLSIGRAAAVDTTLAGYYIPKGTLVMPVISSALQDPKIWPEPNLFNPARFLDSNGALKKPEEFIPFSAGKRACLGESFAKMELFLFVTAIVQRFTLRLPDGAPPPSLEGVMEMSRMPHPYKFCAVLNK